MRKINPEKRNAVNQAVIKLSATTSLSEISMGKIAKEAAVSPSTLYIYYPNKQEMISQVYMLVKAELDEGVENLMENANDGFQKLDLAMNQFAYNARKALDKLVFMRAVQSNLSILTDEAKTFHTAATAAVRNICQKLQAENQMKKLSDELVTILLTAPLFDFISQYHSAENDDFLVEIDQLISVILDGLKK